MIPLPAALQLAAYVALAAQNVGTIKGTITPPERVVGVQAVDRKNKNAHTHEAKFDAKTGKFTVAGLPPGRTYDLIVLTPAGEIQGVDMQFNDGEFARLVRKKRRGKPSHEFTDDDFEQIISHILGIEQYEDIVRPLCLAEFGGRATVLVEKIRTRDFHSQQGDEYIWRTELWYFRFRYGGWEKVPNVAQVLESRRLPVSAFKQINLVYEPKLGGIEIPKDGEPRAINYRLPKKLDPRRGRVGGKIPKFDPKDLRPSKEPATKPAPGQPRKRPSSRQAPPSSRTARRVSLSSNIRGPRGA